MLHRSGEWPWATLAEATSDARGEARLELPPGAALFLRVGWRSDVEFQTLKEPALAAGERRDLELRMHAAPTTTLRFLVRLADGSPVAGARVFPLEGEEFPPILTGPDGRAEQPGATAEYSFLVGATKEGFSPAYFYTFIKDGAVLELVLEPEAVLEGRLLGPDGEPASGVELSLRTSSRFWGVGLPDSVLTRRQRTGPDGGFRFSGLRPRIGYLAAAARGEALLHRSLPPPPAGTTWTELRLHAGSSLQGTVIDGDGRAIAGVALEGRRMVALGSAEEEDDGAFLQPLELARTRSSEDGTFRWDGVEPGVWAIGLDGHTSGAPRPALGSTEPAAALLAEPVFVELAPGGLAEAVIQLRRGLMIRGTLIGPDGEALGAGEVVAVPEDGSSDPGAATRRIEADGSFTVGPLLPGPHRLSGQDDAWEASGEVEAVAAGSAGVRLVLQAEAPIAGQVLGPDGQPRRARVIASIRSLEDPEMWFPTTDAEGRFRITPSRGGSWDLIAVTEDGLVACSPGLRTRNGRTTELTLTLRRGAAVRWELPEATELGWAEVRVGGQLLYQGRAGFLSSLRALPEGQLELKVTAPGGSRWQASSWLQDGAEAVIRPGQEGRGAEGGG